MKNLIEDTIGKIKNQHIKPESKWKFLAKKYGMWFVFAVIVFLGAASLSTAYYIMTSLDWDLYQLMHQNLFQYFLSTFPYFWALLIGVFLLVAFFDVRRTETGYRYSLLKISLITMVSIFLLGVAMSYLGTGERFNGMMQRGFPYYGQHMVVTKETQWSKPADGFLSGTINSISYNELVIIDFSEKKWSILLSNETLIRPRADISKGQMIKIIGIDLGDNKFQANEIRPWIGMGQGMMGNGKAQQGGMMR